MKTNARRRTIVFVIIMIICAVVLFAYLKGGDMGVKTRTDATDYVMENHVKETGATNAVTAIYLNYRLWDTLFEAMVLLLSAMAVISFSWSHDDEAKL